MLKREEIIEGQTGFLPKNENRYRYCNDLNDEEGLFRCTREIKHKGPHAAHTTRGIEGTTDENGNVIPGMKNTEIVQLATWWYPQAGVFTPKQ
jgi:hypothetical protein